LTMTVLPYSVILILNQKLDACKAVANFQEETK